MPSPPPLLSAKPPSLRPSSQKPPELSTKPPELSTKPAALSTKPPQPLPESSSPDETCVVCSEPLLYCALMDCGHRTCCSVCASRLRLLHSDDKCVLCKQVPDRVFILSQNDKRTHAALLKQTWGQRTDGFILDELTGFYFSERLASHLKQLQRLREPRCESCKGEVFPSSAELQRHLDSVHRTTLCPLCLEFGGRFVMELPRLTRKQLAVHYRSGEAKTAFSGHPTCKFCSEKAFYNDDMLYKHLKESHEACFLCARLGSRFQYYENFAALAAHFSSDHFACTDPTCVANRFCVFATDLELQAHYASEHPNLPASARTIAVDFTVRSRPSSAPPEPHAAAANPSSLSASDFPSLTGRPGLASTSWRGSQPSSSRLSPADFPSLGRTGLADLGAQQRASTQPSTQHFPALPKPVKPRLSAVERFEQMQNRPPPRDVRGPRQDAEALEVLHRDNDNDDTPVWTKKAKGKKPPGRKAGKPNMLVHL